MTLCSGLCQVDWRWSPYTWFHRNHRNPVIFGKCCWSDEKILEKSLFQTQPKITTEYADLLLFIKNDNKPYRPVTAWAPVTSGDHWDQPDHRRSWPKLAFFSYGGRVALLSAPDFAQFSTFRPPNLFVTDKFPTVRLQGSLLFSTGLHTVTHSSLLQKLLGLHRLASSLTSLTDLTGISKSNKLAPMQHKSLDTGRKANFLLNPKISLSCLCNEHTRRETCSRDAHGTLHSQEGKQHSSMSNTLRVGSTCSFAGASRQHASRLAGSSLKHHNNRFGFSRKFPFQTI